MAYSYDLPQGLTEESILRAFLDMVGINFNPAIIWNALPWTFTVDWLLGVSQWLDQFKVRLIEPRIYIRDICYSYKIARTVRCWSSHDEVGNIGNSVVESFYYRSKPTGLTQTLRGSGLSFKEFSLAAALAGSR